MEGTSLPAKQVVFQGKITINKTLRGVYTNLLPQSVTFVT